MNWLCIFFYFAERFLKATFCLQRINNIAELSKKDTEIKTTRKIFEFLSFSSMRCDLLVLPTFDSSFLSTGFLLFLGKKSEINEIELVGAGHAVAADEPIDDQRFAVCHSRYRYSSEPLLLLCIAKVKNSSSDLDLVTFEIDFSFFQSFNSIFLSLAHLSFVNVLRRNCITSWRSRWRKGLSQCTALLYPARFRPKCDSKFEAQISCFRWLPNPCLRFYPSDFCWRRQWTLESFEAVPSRLIPDLQYLIRILIL